MSAENSGVSRFQDSDVYGVPTFINGATLSKLVSAVGDVGYSYQPTLIPASGASYTTNVAKALYSQLLPAGTYIASIIATSTAASAVIQDTYVQLLGTVGAVTTTYGAFESGTSNQTFSDVGNNSIPLTCIIVLPDDTTMAVYQTFAFTAGTITVTASSQFCTFTRIA